MKETDYDELSFKQLLKYAEKGDEWAQYLVGLEYAFPENDEEADEEEAVRWFSKAAEAGVPEARFRMAERLFTGSGIEQDPEAAYDLALKVAEEADLPEAWALLGFMYGAGVPVEEDMDKCRELLEKGASMGSEYAQSLLDELDNGTLFEDGEDEDDYDDDYEDDEVEDEEEDDDDEEEDDEDEDDEEDDEDEDDEDDDEVEFGEGDEDDGEEEEGTVYDGTDGFPKNDYIIDADRVTAEARRGNIHAIKTLAWGYYKGVYGLPENRKEGWKWYERGADKNDLWCLRELGVLYTIEDKGRKALKIFEQGIKSGSGDCCEKAGDLYFYGKAGISKDYHKAGDYYWKGHSIGHAGCIASLAAMAFYGNGAEINLEHAKFLYRDAAGKGLKWAWKMAGLSAERQRHFDEARQIYLEGIEHGSWICACNLGLLYYAGRFGEQNMERCAEYYREAIENGETQGYACMGEVFYEMGEYDQALSLFREGDDEGNPDCSAWLGRLDIEHGSAGKGVQTLRNALDRGSSLAGLFLGDYYYGQKNYSTALQYYHKAANRNVGPALLKLGRMYFDGEGTPKKYTSARIFLERAWEFGQDQAEAAIRVLKHYRY